MTTTDPALATFEAERRRLFGIAYRMLGSVREAEDVLQDAYLRWHGVEHEEVDDSSAYLTRIVTRLCIDVRTAAHRRRIEYVGPWLPEPLVRRAADDASPHPDDVPDLAPDLSTAFLLLLERLNAVQRAVFLLRESFDLPYRQIADVVDRTVPNCRQIARRARERLDDVDRARSAPPEEHDRLLARFLAATREGDVDALLELLADDVVAYGDGGGVVPAARRPVRGPDRVGRYAVGLSSKTEDRGARTRRATVNGRTGLVVHLDERLYAVTSFHVADGAVRGIYTVLNPEKLPGHRERSNA